MCLLPLFAFLPATPLASQSPPPPNATYRTFDTPHFSVVYAEGLREVALRAAAHAEQAHGILEETFLPPPPGPIELLVTDHADLANGFASAAPRPRMTLWARPPMDATALSHFDDWIGLVSMHELAHLFQLEHSGPLGGALRRVFGRPPLGWPFFPGHLLPNWAIEGAAVHIESEHTGGGRLHGTAHEAIARAQALDGGVEGLGQALGRSPVWPGGSRPYVFGSLFFHWLDERYGAGTVRDFLASAGEQWIPYRLDAAARAATGRSLGELWDEWRREVEREAGAAAEARAESAAGLEYLTRGAREAGHPAPAPSGEGVAYVRADGRSQIRLVLRGADGEELDLARWNDRSRPAWDRDGTLLATQPEFVDRWRLRRDLYRVDPGGSVRRLTHDMRILHVDPHPETGTIAAVQEVDGTNRLLALDPDGAVERVLREADPGVHWAFPRWSPDGRRLAVVRWRRGGHTALVLIDPDEPGEVEVIEDRALHASPTWSPDGSWLVWASDRGGAFDLYARRVEQGRPVGRLRQITRAATGATDPAIDAEGRWIYHSRLGSSGWDLARIPFEPGAWREPVAARSRFIADAGAGSGAEPHGGTRREGGIGGDEGDAGDDLGSAHERAGGPPPPTIVKEDRPWSSWSALWSARPGYWLPTLTPAEWAGDTRVLPWALGFETEGSDLVGRHRWSLESTVPLPGLDARPEARVRWRWAGLGQPALTLSAEQRMYPLARIAPEQAPGDTLYPVTRERSAGLDARLVRQRVRSIVVLSAGAREVRQRRTLREADGSLSERFQLTRPHRTLTELRTSLAVSTRQSHAFSISVEEGAAASLRLRKRWERALPDSVRGESGLDGSFHEAVAWGRAFVPLPPAGPIPDFARVALGVQGAVGAAAGPGAGAGHFRVGGGGGGGSGPAGFTRGETTPLFSVRGFPRGTIAGDRAWAAGAEVRVPLANLHAARGALPLHLDRLAGGAFFDVAGASRMSDGARAWRSRASAGVEATLSHSIFFQDGGRFRVGVAFPVVGGSGASVYVQSGWSF